MELSIALLLTCDRVTDLCIFLLQNGAKVNQVDSGFTPLHHAAEHGHADICTLLLDHGAEIEAESGDRTVLCHCLCWDATSSCA